MVSPAMINPFSVFLLIIKQPETLCNRPKIWYNNLHVAFGACANPLGGNHVRVKGIKPSPEQKGPTTFIWEETYECGLAAGTEVKSIGPGA
jgi:hypothetical protein